VFVAVNEVVSLRKRTNKTHFSFVIYFNNLSSACFE
jgi:hypothetical protein